jgi:hypothetical protein
MTFAGHEKGTGSRAASWPGPEPRAKAILHGFEHGEDPPLEAGSASWLAFHRDEECPKTATFPQFGKGTIGIRNQGGVAALDSYGRRRPPPDNLLLYLLWTDFAFLAALCGKQACITNHLMVHHGTTRWFVMGTCSHGCDDHKIKNEAPEN